MDNFAPELTYEIPTASSVSTNTTQGNAADPIKENIEQLVQSLTSVLNDGLHKPKIEILTFDGNALEYM